MTTMELFGHDAAYADAIVIMRTAMERCEDPAGRNLLHGAICHVLNVWRDYQEHGRYGHEDREEFARCIARVSKLFEAEA